MNGEPYTPEQILFLKTHGADMSTKELCSALNKQFNTTHSAQSVRTTAKKHGVRLDSLMRANPDIDPYNMLVGTILIIPEE